MTKEEVEVAEPKKDAADQQDSDSDDEPSHSFDLKFITKLSGFAFILFVMLNTDVFIERVLGRMHTSLVDGRSPTMSGVFVQGLIFSVTLIGIAYAVAMEKL